MNLRAFGVALLALPLLYLQGCANNQSIPELPTNVGENGLIVARLYVLGMQAMDNAQIDIDGRLVSSSLRDGYVAVSLTPGEHKLNLIRAEGQLISRGPSIEEAPIRPAGYTAPIFIYVPGYTIHYTTLTVNRTFTVEAGKVTNLGLIVYLPASDTGEKAEPGKNNSRAFDVVTLDNSTEIATFLDTNYPELVSSLKDRTIQLAPGKYFDMSKLPALRRAIAYHESKGPNIINAPNRTAVFGRAGTLVVLSKPASGTKPDVNVVDTGTLADIVGGIHVGDNFTFLTSDAKLLSLDGDKLAQSSFPNHIQPVLFRSLGKQGMLVIDNRLRILTARFLGDPWNEFEGAMTKTARNDVTAVSDGDGTYVSLGKYGAPEAIYYVRANESVPITIKSPELPSHISRADLRYFVARQAGLYVLYNKSDFYFWSKANQRWEVHTRPGDKCKPMQLDEEGRNISIECDGVGYRSADSGAAWTKNQI